MRSVSAYLTRTVVIEEGMDMSGRRAGSAPESPRGLSRVGRAKHRGARNENRGARAHNRGGILAVHATVDFDGSAAAARGEQVACGGDLRQRMGNEGLAAKARI